MQLCLGLLDVFRVFTCDPNLVLPSSNGAWGSVTVDSGKWRWEIDGGVGGRFDQSNVLSCSSTYDGVKREFELHHIDGTFELSEKSVEVQGQLEGAYLLSDRS